MLVLTRKEGQAIDVGDDVRIIVHEIRGRHAKIAIVAPREVRIRRTEVAQTVAAENRRAAETSIDIGTRFRQILGFFDQLDFRKRR